MSFGKSSSTTTPQLTQEQRDQIAMANQFMGSTLIPTYQGVIGTTLGNYNQAMPGVTNAAQNLASTGSQASQTLGETGESALRTGVTGLESLFTPDYEANQIASALAPAQSQYMQNLAQQKAQFGGTGNLGSAREALAGQQLAGQTMATQAQTAAQVQKDIAAQRAAAAQSLAGIGQTGVQGAVTAAGVPLSAAQAGTDYWNKTASLLFGTPQVNPNFTGAQGQTKTGSSFGISI